MPKTEATYWRLVLESTAHAKTRATLMFSQKLESDHGWILVYTVVLHVYSSNLINFTFIVPAFNSLKAFWKLLPIFQSLLKADIADIQWNLPIGSSWPFSRLHGHTLCHQPDCPTHCTTVHYNAALCIEVYCNKFSVALFRRVYCSTVVSLRRLKNSVMCPSPCFTVSSPYVMGT